ncbi:MAG: glycosyltransferase [Clostridia bacterium]|nr:glycosyltransferase [Clostridia bacterium]
MKILQINATYGIGSTGFYTKVLHEKLKERGHESYVVTAAADSSAEKDSDIFVAGGKFSRKINALRARLTGNQNSVADGVTKKIIEFIDAKAPDVIQLGNIHANFVNFKKLLKYISKKNIALIVVLHDCWFFTGKCTNYVDAGCLKWQKKCGDCPKIKDDIPSWLYDKTEAMLEEKKALFAGIKKLTVVGVSEKITEDAKKSYVFSGRNCICIPNAVDDTIFFPGNEKSPEDDSSSTRTIVGAAAKWSMYKGIDDFIKLGELCGSSFGDSVQIKLAGGFEHLGEDVKERLKKSNVQMLGCITPEELATLYRGSDVFVSMSKGESFGCSISEAIMCGLPVVSYSGYAEGEILRKNSNCYVVDNQKSVEKIFRYITRILNSDKGKKTKSGISDDYRPLDIGEYVEKFLTIYEEF